jgi:hypothetical protein
MLQIDIEDRSDSGLLFTLKGELSGAYAGEFMARWQEFSRICLGTVCIVDLSSVAAMDERGRQAICALAHAGVRFLARGPMLGHVIDSVCKASFEASRAGRADFRARVSNI